MLETVRGKKNVLLLSLLFTLVTRAEAEWFKHQFEVMGTTAQVELWHDNTKNVASSVDELFAMVEAEMQRIESVMSPYIASSELSEINRKAFTQSVTLSSEMYHLITRSLEYSALSGGAFDISFASVGAKYDFRKAKRPSDQDIAKLIDAINYKSIRLSQAENSPSGFSLKFLNLNVKIDLGGIAKGYAVDQSIEILHKHSVRSAMVSAGGDSRYMGHRGVDETSGGEIPWMIAIRHPRDKQKHALRLPLTDTAVSTSGDYERFFFDGEERVHHILSPKTGRSASEVVSVSVLGARSIDCDALSTTVFVMGVEKGIALIDRLEGYDAVVIDKAGRVHYSAGLASVE